jgi:microcystin-dependent protein
MSEPYLGEVRLLGFGFAPRGWALCDGQLLAIAQNQALFSLLGTTYGGDGRTTFALPDLRGRAPLHFGNGIALGQSGGSEAVTLALVEMPAHTHTLVASADVAVFTAPAGNVLAKKARFGADVYATPDGTTPLTTLAPATLETVGGQPHENRQPYLTLTFAIALQGVYPSRS